MSSQLGQERTETLDGGGGSDCSNTSNDSAMREASNRLDAFLMDVASGLNASHKSSPASSLDGNASDNNSDPATATKFNPPLHSTSGASGSRNPPSEETLNGRGSNNNNSLSQWMEFVGSSSSQEESNNNILASPPVAPAMIRPPQTGISGALYLKPEKSIPGRAVATPSSNPPLTVTAPATSSHAPGSMTSSLSSGTSNTPLIPTLFGKRIELPSTTSCDSTIRSVASSSTAAAATTSGNTNFTMPQTKKRKILDTTEVSEDESERERRRQDRNLREQQRSHQINHQIGDLREMLVAAGIRFKPDKYSTLATVGSYIKELQEKKNSLEEQHQKLLDTITETASIMSKQHIPNASSASDGESAAMASGYSDLLADGNTTQDESCPGIDYKAIFSCCSLFGSAVTSIDGRFLDCNKGFEDVSGFSRPELLPLNEDSKDASPVVGEDGVERNLSLFNILAREDMENVFLSMSNLLKRPVLPNQVPEDLNFQDTWTAYATLCRKDGGKIQLCLSLIRTSDGRPRLFNCTIIPQGANQQAMSMSG